MDSPVQPKFFTATNSSASATGVGSLAEIDGSQGSLVIGSTAVDTDGSSTIVNTSDTHAVNGP